MCMRCMHSRLCVCILRRSLKKKQKNIGAKPQLMRHKGAFKQIHIYIYAYMHVCIHIFTRLYVCTYVACIHFYVCVYSGAVSGCIFAFHRYVFVHIFPYVYTYTSKLYMYTLSAFLSSKKKCMQRMYTRTKNSNAYVNAHMWILRCSLKKKERSKKRPKVKWMGSKRS